MSRHLDEAAEHVQRVLEADVVAAAQAAEAGALEAHRPIHRDVAELAERDGGGLAELVPEAVLADALRGVHLLVSLHNDALSNSTGPRIV